MENFGIAVGVAMSVTQLIKQVVPELQPRFYPLISLFIGGLMGYLYKLGPATCLIIGLTASGVYSGVKAVVKKELSVSKKYGSTQKSNT